MMEHVTLISPNSVVNHLQCSMLTYKVILSLRHLGKLGSHDYSFDGSGSIN